MRKLIWPLCLMTAGILSACGLLLRGAADEPAPSSSDPPESTPAAHTDLYREGIDTEEVLAAFSEAVLHAEYSSGKGDASLVQKWGKPILYYIHGAYAEEDLRILQDFFRELNTIPGFPGIEEAPDESGANLDIGFYGADEFNDEFGDAIAHEVADGAMQYWYYNKSNVIYRGRVGYRTDTEQKTRSSVLLEEIVNVLGFNDSVTREDSIIYQYGSHIEELSEMDWLLIRLLYHKDIRAGMDDESCTETLRRLYH